jgi:hypothetical protein
MIIKCECEAVYEQIEFPVTNWVEDTVDCKICGHELKSWRGNVFVSLELIRDPTECPNHRRPSQ